MSKRKNRQNRKLGKNSLKGNFGKNTKRKIKIAIIIASAILIGSFVLLMFV